MEISNLRTNKIENPLGFQFDRVSFSWITEAKSSVSTRQIAAQVEVALDANFNNIIFDSGKEESVNSLAFYPDIELIPRTRYYWRVTVWGDKGDVATSKPAWFETAKMEEPWQAQWIKPNLNNDVHPIIRKKISIEENISSARVYICGLGLYELFINGEKTGDEYFAPGYNAYDFWLQYQTYDITDQLTTGDNVIDILLGNGWYKGRFGLDGGYHNLYGDEFSLIAEVIITHQDGTTSVIGTNEDWDCAPSPVMFSGIYDGEVYDANKEITSTLGTSNVWKSVIKAESKSEKLQARLSLPVKIKEEIRPVKKIITPKNEIVLDFGQNITGWVRFKANVPKGHKLKLQYGEILQDGCFYQDNLRTAKAEYIYISDGQEREVQPHFTFYGFRYAKLTGFEEEINLNDFTGCVIYSDIEEVGYIETSDSLVNQLFLNAKWGQKGNFLDVPTDCPQRDERMGWTGDAQIFANTACYNMYSPAFYTKYLKDLREEQKRLGGSVPFIVPTLKPDNDPGFVTGHGSSAWGDAATIIPWTLYIHYGDKRLLENHFGIMKDWVDYIKKMDDESGAKRLWQSGFHFGDWLALDGKNPNSPFGGTEEYYVASAYYYYSTTIVAKAAEVLGKSRLADYYYTLASEIKEAITDEYFTKSGRCAIETQTALVLALYMDLVPEQYRNRIINDLKNMLREDNMHLTTGFVGTPYLAITLSEHGAVDYAYTLLMNEDYPSWLYAVKLGATTIWERWNSVLPDGKISGSGMNSLNHYVYGSIAEWMYRYMCGINPSEESPGFKKIKLTPQPNGKLSYAKSSFYSPSGLIESGWKLDEDGHVTFKFTIPFDTTAELLLPDADLCNVTVNGVPLNESNIVAEQIEPNVKCRLFPGEFEFMYYPTRNYIPTFNTDNKISDLMKNKDTKQILQEEIPEFISNSLVLKQISESSIQDLKRSPYTKFLTEEKLNRIDIRLNKITI